MCLQWLCPGCPLHPTTDCWDKLVSWLMNKTNWVQKMCAWVQGNPISQTTLFVSTSVSQTHLPLNLSIYVLYIYCWFVGGCFSWIIWTYIVPSQFPYIYVQVFSKCLFVFPSPAVIPSCDQTQIILPKVFDHASKLLESGALVPIIHQGL